MRLQPTSGVVVKSVRVTSPDLPDGPSEPADLPSGGLLAWWDPPVCVREGQLVLELEGGTTGAPEVRFKCIWALTRLVNSGVAAATDEGP